MVEKYEGPWVHDISVPQQVQCRFCLRPFLYEKECDYLHIFIFTSSSKVAQASLRVEYSKNI